MRKILIAKFGNRPNMGKIHPKPLPHFDSSMRSKYDFIVVMHVLEHVRDQYEARSFLLSCFQMLKHDGHLLVISPDFKDYKEMFYELDWSHGYLTSVERIRSLMQDIGFLEVNSIGTRAGFKSAFITLPLCVLDKIIPYSVFDLVFFRLLKHRLLASGFAVGFLKKNVAAIGKKE